MENIDSTNIDNLYRAGLAHYAEALFAARHFELLLDQAITNAFDEAHKTRMVDALGSELTGGGFFSNSPGASNSPRARLEFQNTLQQQWWMWVTHNHWIKKPGITLLIGYWYEAPNSCAVIAMNGMNAGIRDRLIEALTKYKKDFAEWNGYEIHIHSKPLALDGSQQDFISALKGILDEFIQFLEHQNQQAPNWITTLV